MHELFGSLELTIENFKINSEVYQLGFFIIAFQGYVTIQSFYRSLISLSILIWITTSYTSVNIILGIFLGLILGIITAKTLRYPKSDALYLQVFYYTLQPLYFYFFLPLYVIQTKYPVGVILTFILWFGFELIFSSNEITIVQRALIDIPVIIGLFVLFWTTHTHWTAVSVVLGLQMILLILITYFFQKKNNKI